MAYVGSAWSFVFFILHLFSYLNSWHTLEVNTFNCWPLSIHLTNTSFYYFRHFDTSTFSITLHSIYRQTHEGGVVGDSCALVFYGKAAVFCNKVGTRRLVRLLSRLVNFTFFKYFLWLNVVWKMNRQYLNKKGSFIERKKFLSLC